ncbi:hypothetical protein SEPCBS119000_004763 [Sporothrix epigloea]|uniref:Zn(2)-C6 fungal-type domain-containing protein n=1 Tax=Sporothrix epigloea TaxID=1892477 RepID=A0ABP0DTV9_9PEZI
MATVATVGGSKTAKYPTKLRRNQPRSRSGCLTCRQRKKKCDELRPQCVGCTRNKLPCVWPARNPKTSSGGTGDTGDTSAVEAAAPPNSAGHLSCSLMPCSNLMLYQHKSRWQTYLPSLAAWEGVEGCSVNLSPAYDEPGLWRDVMAMGQAKASTNLRDTITPTESTTQDKTGYVRPTPSPTSCVDNNMSAAAPVASIIANQDNTGQEADGEGHDNNGETLDKNGADRESDSADSTNSWGEDPDAPLAVWSQDMVSFVTVAPGLPRANSGNAHSQPRQQQRQQQEEDKRQREPASIPGPARPIQHPRVAAMTPLSATMLRHYIVEAATTLSTGRTARNPYIAAFLPLAYTDDLVMHCVLAIGGAHLSSRLQRPCADDGLLGFAVPSAATTALHEATTRHYSCVLRSLRVALRDLQPADGPHVLRVLAVLLLLSTYECLSWNTTGGGVFAHLRASRQLIGWLRADASKASSLSPDERSMFGALLEIYAYQLLANRICPDGSVPGRFSAGEGPADDHDDEDFVADPALLQDQDCFGLLFSGLHGLFALIPAVSRLAAAAIRRASPDAIAVSADSTLLPGSLSSLFGDTAGSGVSAPSIAAKVIVLRNRALAWQLPAAFLSQSTGDQERIWQRAIGEVYRHALLVYIESISMQHTADQHASAATFQRHIHAIGEAVLGADLVASRFATILLWPLLIAGSILVHPDERTFLAEGLRTSPQATWSSIRAAEVLEKLWARRKEVMPTCALASTSFRAGVGTTAGHSSSSSQKYFGPCGLAQIMRETNINLCVG